MWPPKPHEIAIFKQVILFILYSAVISNYTFLLIVFLKEWNARYTKLIRDGKTSTFPVIGPPKESKHKLKFNCLLCQV